MGKHSPNTTFEGYPARSYLRADGKEQIIYGPADQIHTGGKHGHVSFDPQTGSVDYWRSPDHHHKTGWYLDSHKDDHTRI